MASAPKPQREPTEAPVASAGGHARRRAVAVAMIVVGVVVFFISATVLALSARDSVNDATDGAQGPVQGVDPPSATSEPGGEEAPAEPEPSTGVPPPEGDGADGAPEPVESPSVESLADAHAELTAMADALATEPAFSDQMIETLEDVADTVSTSLHAAIADGAAEAATLLEGADEILDELTSAAVPDAPTPGSMEQVLAVASLVGAVDGLPTPTPSPKPDPDLAPAVEFDDYVALAGAAGGLLTAVAGVITAVSEWRRTRRDRAAARRSAARAATIDGDDEIRPS